MSRAMGSILQDLATDQDDFPSKHKNLLSDEMIEVVCISNVPG